MVAPSSVPASRLSRRLARSRTALAALAAALAVAVFPARAERGAWSPPYNLNGEAIHMAVVPGDGNPDWSRVIWWQSGTIGGVLGWQPGSDGCASWPSTFTVRDSPGTWNPGANL